MRISASRLKCPDGIDPRLHWGFIAGKLDRLVSGITRPRIICFRGWKLDDDETHDVVSEPTYRDTGLLLYPDALTNAAPFVFPMSSYAYQRDSKLSPDADGDGRGDVATIKPGHYVLRLALTRPHPIWTLETVGGSTRIPCGRDTNHDGKIQPGEWDKGPAATAVLLHTGWDAPADAAHRSSIACQCASLSTLRVIERAGPVLDYQLINAWDAIALLEAGESEPPPPGDIA